MPANNVDNVIDLNTRRHYHRAIASIPHSMIAQFLCFPSDAEMLGASYNVDTGCWDIIVKHSSLPAITEGKQYAKVRPYYKSEERDGELWVCFERFEVEKEQL